jgi:hypothetical protein
VLSPFATGVSRVGGTGDVLSGSAFAPTNEPTANGKHNAPHRRSGYDNVPFQARTTRHSPDSGLTSLVTVDDNTNFFTSPHNRNGTITTFLKSFSRQMTLKKVERGPIHWKNSFTATTGWISVPQHHRRKVDNLPLPAIVPTNVAVIPTHMRKKGSIERDSFTPLTRLYDDSKDSQIIMI